MTQLYIPQLGDLIRLTAPLTISIAETNNAWGNNPNDNSFWRIVNVDEPWDYQRSRFITDATLEIGTVLAFRRYHVSVHAKTNDVEVSIFVSPRPDLTPKKNGGKGTMVKLVLPTAVLNRIEYEKVIP